MPSKTTPTMQEQLKTARDRTLERIRLVAVAKHNIMVYWLDARAKGLGVEDLREFEVKLENLFVKLMAAHKRAAEALTDKVLTRIEQALTDSDNLDEQTFKDKFATTFHMLVALCMHDLCMLPLHVDGLKYPWAPPWFARFIPNVARFSDATHNAQLDYYECFIRAVQSFPVFTSAIEAGVRAEYLITIKYLEQSEETKGSRAATDWRDIQARAERIREQGGPAPTQRVLADRLGCSLATMNKAIQDSTSLKGWMKRSSARATKLSEVVLDAVEQRREPDLSDQLTPKDVDRIMSLTIAKADPQDAARLRALDDDGRLRLAEAIHAQELDDEPSPLEEVPPERRRVVTRPRV